MSKREADVRAANDLMKATFLIDKLIGIVTASVEAAAGDDNQKMAALHIAFAKLSEAAQAFALIGGSIRERIKD